MFSFNIGFTFGIQYSRWTLGSFATHGFELLSGILIGDVYHNRIYWPLFLLINCCIILIGGLSVYVKKYLIYRTSQNMVQEIHIGLEDQNDVNMNENFNNQPHNMPMLNSYEIPIMFISAVAIFSIFTIPYFININDEFTIHYSLLLTEILTEYLYCIIVPLYITMMKKTVRIFIWNELKNLF